MPPAAQKKPRRGLGVDKSKKEHTVTNGKSNGALAPIGKDQKISADTRIQVCKIAGDKEVPAEVGTQRQPKSAVLIPLFREIEPVRYCDLKDIKNFVRRSERILDRADATSLSGGTMARQSARVRSTPPRQAAQKANLRRKEAQRLFAAKDEAVFTGKLKRSSSSSSSETAERRASRKLAFDDEDEEEKDHESEGSEEEEVVMPLRTRGTLRSTSDESTLPRTRSGRITSLKETHAKARRRLLGKGKQSQGKRKAKALEEDDEESNDDQESSTEPSDAASSPSEESDEEVSRASEAASNSSGQESEISGEEQEEESQTSSEEEELPRRIVRRRELPRVIQKNDNDASEEEEAQSDDENEEENQTRKRRRAGKKVLTRMQKRVASESDASEDDVGETAEDSSSNVRHRVSESFESSSAKRAKTALMQSPVNGKRRVATNGTAVQKRTPQKKSAIVLLLSGFEQDRKVELQSWAENVGMRVTDDVSDPSCSHVVVPQPRRHVKCPRTLKVLVGLAKGLPIMSELWITECKRKSRPCSAAPYELNEHFPGVQQRRNRQGKGLLQGLSIFVMRGTMPDPDQMVLLIGMAGGTVAKSLKSCDLCIGPEQSFRVVRRTGVRFLADSSFLDALQIGELPAADALEL